MEETIRSFEYCLDYFAEQVSDVPDNLMVAQPGGVSNHPAWVIGHLTCSCWALGQEIGLDSSWLPASWAKRFGTGSLPVADPEAYEPKTELLSILHDGRNRLLQGVSLLSPEALQRPLSQQVYHSVLPTLRDALTQMMVAHTANHIGQVTIWRRLVGLPTLKRHFL